MAADVGETDYDMGHDESTVTNWIRGVKVADPDAARQLWERYYARLVALARTKLRGANRRIADEEDVALSAFARFCQAAGENRFPQLDNRQDLWRLLMRITVDKAIDARRREGRQSRGGGRVRGESAFTKSLDRREAAVGINGVVGTEPTPEFAATVAEECGRLIALLNDDVLREVALAKMEGYTNREIAERLDRSVATVERSLRLIRLKWEHEAGQ